MAFRYRTSTGNTITNCACRIHWWNYADCRSDDKNNRCNIFCNIIGCNISYQMGKWIPCISRWVGMGSHNACSSTVYNCIRSRQDISLKNCKENFKIFAIISYPNNTVIQTYHNYTKKKNISNTRNL